MKEYLAFLQMTPMAQGGVAPFFYLGALFLARLFPIIAMVPFFGAKVLPHPVKATLGVSLYAIFLPQLAVLVTTQLDFSSLLVMLFFKELLVGAILGFIFSLPFIIAQNAGILIDHQRGGASLMINDPTIQNQSSPLGTLFNLVLIYSFFMMDGPYIVLDILAQSYKTLPPDHFIDAAFFSDASVVFQRLKHILGDVMILSVQLAAPALIMILMTDFFLGIVNRLAPQVQITFLGMPLKSLLAMLIVFLGWHLFHAEVVKQTKLALNQVYQLIQYLHSAGSPLPPLVP